MRHIAWTYSYANPSRAGRRGSEEQILLLPRLILAIARVILR